MYTLARMSALHEKIYTVNDTFLALALKVNLYYFLLNPFPEILKEHSKSSKILC
jgi:hypothetical protein